MGAVASCAGVIRTEHIMGMPIVFDVRDVDDPAALDPLVAWLRFADETFSTYLADSQINRFNRGELTLEDAHPLVREVVILCEELRVQTGGFFDARAARADYVDPSGLVKGWAVERAADLAVELGWRNFAINAGGDIRLRGGALPAPRWRIGIQHPGDAGEIVGVVAGDDLAVATSGTYERGEHVLDPHTRRPPVGVASVTVTGRNLATADALATAIFAMGAEGPAWSAQLCDHEAFIVLEDGRSLRTPRFPLAAG